MRAVQVAELSGPGSALRVAEVGAPTLSPMFAGDQPVVVDVHAAGVSFPEVLQTRGQYQYQPPLPFTPGSEVAGVVVEAPEGSGLAAGDRVAAFCGTGGWAEQVVAPASLTFRLPDHMSYAEGAGFVLNYHTAHFGLVTRGQLAEGERVLVHGAAGGLGSAAVDLASALGAEVVAVVSSDEKAELARACGAADVLRAGTWKAELDERHPDGVDVVIDPVGGAVMTDSLRSLRPLGRHVVLGFAGGEIPEVKANRLLLRNISVVGAGWGAYALAHPELSREVQAELEPLLQERRIVPRVGVTYPWEDAALALADIDERRALGKVVLLVR